MHLTKKAGVYLILALAAILPYSRIFTLGFTNFDDPGYVTQNVHVRAGLTKDGLIWALTSTGQSNWHPVTWLSHMLDCQIYGLNPAGHHITNLFFHLACTLLLFGVFHRMTGALGRSALVATLFAVHPLHVESVAWVAERKDVLSTFFWMLTIWAYVRYAKTRRPADYLWVMMWLALGLASKPMLVTLPFALLLLDVWPLERLVLRRPARAARQNDLRSSLPNLRPSLNWPVLLEKIPLLLLAIASSIVTYIAQQKEGSVVSFHLLPFHRRLANAVVAYALYVRKAFWPSDLAAFYPRPEQIDSWRFVLSIIFLVLVTFQAVRLWRKRPYFAMGWLWYLGTLVPVIGLVQVGDQALADRYTYIPLIGLSVLAVWAGADVLAHFQIPRRVIGISALALVSGLGVLTWRQVGYWKNSVTLFSRAIAVTGDNDLAYLNFGAALASEGRLDEAVSLYQDILRRKPNLPDIQANLGMIMAMQGKNDHAAVHYSIALRLDPSHPEANNGMGLALASSGKLAEATAHFLQALRTRPRYPEAKYNLGMVLAAQGKPQLAIEQLDEALKLRPDYAEAHEKLALVLAGLGRLDEALPHYSAAARAKPEDAEFHYRFGLALYQRHRLRDAMLELRKTVQLKPGWPDALNTLAWILATNDSTTTGDASEAVRLAEKAVKLAGKPDASMLDTLAAAYATGGRFADAVRTAETAVRLATAAGDKSLASDIEHRCQLYRSGQNYTERSQ